MKIIDLLNKMANKEIEEETIITCNKFFYPLIIMKNELYFIHTGKKELEIMSTKYIVEAIENNYNFNILKEAAEEPTFNDIRETYGLPKLEIGDKKIEKIKDAFLDPSNNVFKRKINEIIDHINNGADE